MKKMVGVLVAALLLGAVMAGHANAYEDALQKVNVYTSGNQVLGALGVAGNGDIAVVYYDIKKNAQYLRRYDFAGRAFTSYDSYLAAGQTIVDVKADGTGNLFFLQKLSDGDGGGVYVTIFDRSGNVLVSTFRVNDTVTGDQEPIGLAVNADGRFVVLWGTNRSTKPVLLVKSYLPDGTAITGAVTVASYSVGTLLFGDIAMDAPGNFVVTWYYHVSPPNTDMYARRFDSAGRPVASATVVNTYRTHAQTGGVVAMNASGQYVIVWMSYGQEGTPDWNIYGQRFDASGGRLGGEFRVSPAKVGRSTPSIVMSNTGAFVVSWEGVGATARSILTREYTPAGIAVGAPLSANTPQMPINVQSRMAVNGDGDYAVVWNGYDSSGDGDVYMNQFSRPGTSYGPLLDGGVSGISGTADGWQYFVRTVSEGQTTLDVTTTGQSGDADLYVRYGALPTETSWDGRSIAGGSNEEVTLTGVIPGYWYIGVKARTDYSDLTLIGTSY